MAKNLKSKILFDGNCIVCDFEISYYKRKYPDLFEIIDISSPTFRAQDFQLTQEQVDKHMHVITPEGKLAIGVDAFAHIWSRIPKFEKYGKIIKMPGVNALAKIGYSIFSTVRPILPKKNRRT